MSSPRSAITDPFTSEETTKDVEVEKIEPLLLTDSVKAPAQIEHSFYYVITDSPEPEPVRQRERGHGLQKR